MVRKLAFAVSLALGTLSVPAHALGLGDLSSKSTLNQNFQGDISLLSVEPEELDAVRVKLADAEAFSRAGVERPFYLSLLRFEPTLTAKGRPVIRVTSEFPIREPFMNFLIEVNWPNGRLLREYTVLLDPPTTTMRRPSPVAAPTKAAPAPAVPKATTAAAPAPSAAAPLPQPSTAASAGASEYGPVKSNETAWSIAKKLRPRGVSMEQMMMALLDANPQAFLEGNVNLLRSGQILRVPSVADIQQLSRQDARQAYRQQQDEWLARRNQRLQQAAESEATVSAEAGAEGQAAETGDKLRIATARPEGSGEAGAGDDDATSPTADDLQSRLLVARENAETTRQEAENLRTRVDELQARLQDMQRLLSLKDEQLAQLQDRVGLEQQVAAVEETATPPAAVEEPAADVVLANQVEQAASETADAVQAAYAETAPDLSAYLESVMPPADYAIGEIPPQVDPDRIVVAAMEGTVSEVVVSEGASAEVPAVESAAAVSEALAPLPAEGEVVVIEEVTDVTTAQLPVESAAEAAAPSSLEPPAVPTAVTEPLVEPAAPASPDVPAKSDSLIPAPLLRLVEQNLLPIAGGGVALLALIGLLVARRRRKADDDEPVAAAATAAGAAVADAEPATVAAAAAVDRPVIDEATLNDLPDSAFLDELSPADLNALQDETGEVDPVSEADVYIAYGRYQQAEELLRQAMQRDPNRPAVTHKLLEVHYATRDADAFSTLAQSMVDAGQDKQDAAGWARAQDMGRELAPGNPLFAPAEERGASGLAAAGVAGAAAAVVAAEADTVDEDTLSLDDLEMSELEAAYEESGLASSELEMPSEVSITLDLDEDSADLTQRPESVVPESIALDELESVDFELPEIEGAAVAKHDLDAGDLDTDTLDLESMMAEAEAAVDQDDSVMNLDSEFSAEELQAQLDELSELSVLAPELDDATESLADTARGSLGLVAEDQGVVSEDVDEPFNLDSDFSIDEGDDEMPEFLAVNDSGESSEPVGEDEVSTKLDLARAYFDMGDDDGARSILEEVVAEGNDSQRGDAQQMLAKIG